MDVDISHNQAKHAEDRIFRGDDPSVGGGGGEGANYSVFLCIELRF